jgi:hypothetical protein
VLWNCISSNKIIKIRIIKLKISTSMRNITENSFRTLQINLIDNITQSLASNTDTINDNNIFILQIWS